MPDTMTTQDLFARWHRAEVLLGKNVPGSMTWLQAQEIEYRARYACRGRLAEISVLTTSELMDAWRQAESALNKEEPDMPGWTEARQRADAARQAYQDRVDESELPQPPAES
jgi:hypothetical protein